MTTWVHKLFLTIVCVWLHPGSIMVWLEALTPWKYIVAEFAQVHIKRCWLFQKKLAQTGFIVDWFQEIPPLCNEMCIQIVLKLNIQSGSWWTRLYEYQIHVCILALEIFLDRHTVNCSCCISILVHNSWLSRQNPSHPFQLWWLLNTLFWVQLVLRVAGCLVQTLLWVFL